MNTKNAMNFSGLITFFSTNKKEAYGAKLCIMKMNGQHISVYARDTLVF